MAEELRPLYDKIDALQGQLSNLSGEMRANMATITATLSERCTTRGSKLDSLADDHEETKSRVSVLEQDKSKMLGAVAAGGATGGFVLLVAKLFSMLGGK